MATLAKILIAAIFVLSNVFLGFTIAAVSNKNDNPKYKYMNEKRMRQVIRFDISRLREESEKERGKSGETGKLAQEVGKLQIVIDQKNKQSADLEKETNELLAKIKEDDQAFLVKKLERIQIDVNNFAATIEAYREALASVERKYFNLQDSYQDIVRQFESLSVEKKRMQIEKERILEDHRALENAYFGAQKESADLTDRIAMMTRLNPELPTLAMQNGPEISGRVQSASPPPNGVVVISVGANEGVIRGQRFSVFDANGNFKAKVTIINVSSNTSVGTVDSPYQNVTINGNDLVRRSAIALQNMSGGGRNR